MTNNIPSLDLYHNGEKVLFAFRTMEEIHIKLGKKKDVPHRHDYYTILWASNACGEHYIDFEQHAIRPNYVFFVNPGQVHQVITYGEPEGVVIMFTGDYLYKYSISEEFLTNLGLFSDSAVTPPLKIEEENAQYLRQIVLNMKESFFADEPFKEEQISAYLKLFLIECNRYAPKPMTENTQEYHSGRKIIKDFKALVESEFKKRHKVGYYAEKLSITSDYLNTVVKETVGKTAKEFIQNRICLEARRIGVHTQLSNKEIAFMLGFDDPSHFSKFYKNIEGQSFSDFRASIKKDM